MLRSLNEGAMSADVLFARLESPSILILEDLKSQGFQMADRCTGLDLSHSKLALVGLAKFHATSILYMENVLQSIFQLTFTLHSKINFNKKISGHNLGTIGS